MTSFSKIGLLCSLTSILIDILLQMTEFRDTEPLLDHIDDDDYDEEVGVITKLFQPDYNSNG